MPEPTRRSAPPTGLNDKQRAAKNRRLHHKHVHYRRCLSFLPLQADYNWPVLSACVGVCVCTCVSVVGFHPLSDVPWQDLCTTTSYSETKTSCWLTLVYVRADDGFFSVASVTPSDWQENTMCWQESVCVLYKANVSSVRKHLTYFGLPGICCPQIGDHAG